MPNMIDNIVGIIGPYERLAELCYAAEQNKFLQTVKPLSSFAEKQAIEHWGVKWEIRDASVFMHSDVGGYDHDWCLEMEFESPWAPPLGAYQILEDEGCVVEAYFLDTSGLDYGGSYRHGDLKTYPTDRLPHDVKACFEESYNYQRLNRSFNPAIKAA